MIVLMTLKALLDWKAHGVVNKPIRPFGIMSSLVLARALGSYHARLEAKVNKLEETLRARRDVEKAIRILMELKSIEEGHAVIGSCVIKRKPNGFRSGRLPRTS